MRRHCRPGPVRRRVQVVPAAAGAHPGLSGPFVLATLSDGEELAYLDNQLQGQVVERPSDVRWVRQAWESIRAEAFPSRTRGGSRPSTTR